MIVGAFASSVLHEMVHFATLVVVVPARRHQAIRHQALFFKFSGSAFDADNVGNELF